MTIMVRYYELALMISSVSKQAFDLMAQDAINHVLENFFGYDALT